MVKTLVIIQQRGKYGCRRKKTCKLNPIQTCHNYVGSIYREPNICVKALKFPILVTGDRMILSVLPCFERVKWHLHTCFFKSWSTIRVYRGPYIQYVVRYLRGISCKHIDIIICVSHNSSFRRTSVSLAFSTAVTASGAKSRWRGAEEQQSSSHSSASCSSSALTGGSDPKPGPTTTPSPPLHPDRDRTGSSADAEQKHTTGQLHSASTRLYASISAAQGHLNNK